MLDRITPPFAQSIKDIFIHPVQSHLFPNKIPFYTINLGEQDVSRIDFMIEAGKWDQPKKLVSTFTNLLIKEGAGNLNSKTIAEQLDYYGAWLQLSDTYHYSYITLYTPNRFFKETLELLEIMIKSPLFPEQELKTNVERRKQQFLIDQEKVQLIALRAFTNVLFGEDHPYGKTAGEKDFDEINRDDILAFFNKYYCSSRTKIFLAGKISNEMILDIEDRFGKNDWGSINEINNSPSYSLSPSTEHELFIQKNNAMQNGIRMGLHTINRADPDFNGLRVMNTILGGYFGSRLMSTIREEKGYTYGISSGITSLKHAAYLTIATQTGCEFTSAVIKEVYNEIDKLQQILVDDEELARVKNYMLGDFVRSIDGVFSLADIYISLLAGNLPFDFYQKQVDCIHNIDNKTVQQLAQKYLKPKSIYTVVAGNRY